MAIRGRFPASKNKAKIASRVSDAELGVENLASCCLSPMRRNSIFKRVKGQEIGEEEICSRAFCRLVILESKEKRGLIHQQILV